MVSKKQVPANYDYTGKDRVKRQRKALTGPREAAFFDDRLKNAQQIEVDLVQRIHRDIHAVDLGFYFRSI